MTPTPDNLQAPLQPTSDPDGGGPAPVKPVKPHGFFRQAMSETHNGLPSSARIIATLIFTALTVLTVLVVLGLMARIMTIQDQMIASALLSTRTKIVLYWFLFFAASSLVLHPGILPVEPEVIRQSRSQESLSSSLAPFGGVGTIEILPGLLGAF